MIEGTVKYEPYDMMFAFYQNGVSVSTMPTSSDAVFDSSRSNCTNGAYIYWNNSVWAPTIQNLKTTRTKCSLYFKLLTVNEKIMNLSFTDTTNLAKDEAGNIRYIGADPNNYVIFNGEKWRIIGTFKDIDDGTGNLEWRTKIIRNANLGSRLWDSSVSSINGGIGMNSWRYSSLGEYLNDLYYSGLSQSAKNMIGDARWNLGTNGHYNSEGTPSTFYTFERSSDNGKICGGIGTYCNDTRPRGIGWIGKIGLMYPSDYGYATGGSTRETCLNTVFGEWYNNADCTKNDWLFYTQDEWTMMPAADVNYASKVHYINQTSGVYAADAAKKRYVVRPTLYLDSNVMISGGSGTSTDPYQLTI